MDENETTIQEHRQGKSLHGRGHDMRRRVADAYRSGEHFAPISGRLGHTIGDRASFLSLGEVFLGGQCLKKDEFSHSREEIKSFQVVPSKLARQNSRPFYEGKMLVDNDQISA